MQVSVQNGTNAGWRVAKEARKEKWVCECGNENKPNHVTCLADGCFGRRPS